jgi:hypothetical protein
MWQQFWQQLFWRMKKPRKIRGFSIPPRGSEQVADSAEILGVDVAGGAECGSAKGNSDLRFLIQVWPALKDGERTAVIAIVRGAVRAQGGPNEEQ